MTRNEYTQLLYRTGMRLRDQGLADDGDAILRIALALAAPGTPTVQSVIDLAERLAGCKASARIIPMRGQP